MCYSRKRPSINFLGPEERLFPRGSPVGYPAQKVYVYVVFSPLIVDKENWADPGVLWKKAPRAMRAIREKTLETVPFQPYFGCTKSFLEVLSN